MKSEHPGDPGQVGSRSETGRPDRAVAEFEIEIMSHERTTHSRRIRRGGFSFAEMMVAVAILALLTTVTGMALLNLVNRSRIKQTRVIMDDVMSALIAYRDELGRWPRDANVDCRPSGSQPDYVLDDFDNGRVFKQALIGKDLRGKSGNTWFDPGVDKWVDDDVNDADMVWDAAVPANEREGIFGEFAEHALAMMKVSASRAVLTELEKAGFFDRREATDTRVDASCNDVNEEYSVYAVKDAWGTEMLYRRIDGENDGFPQFLSAGKDHAFHTADDVRSTDKD